MRIKKHKCIAECTRLEDALDVMSGRPSHTPPPWHIEKGMIKDANGNQVWNIGNNTEFIVRAVNSHEELLDAVTELLRVVDEHGISGSHYNVEHIVELIAKAKGKGA